ncbi:MAG: hypothetical protein ACO35C_07695, partial [Pontimonas sp.]
MAAAQIDTSALHWGPTDGAQQLPVWISLVAIALTQLGFSAFRALRLDDRQALAGYPSDEELLDDAVEFVKQRGNAAAMSPEALLSDAKSALAYQLRIVHGVLRGTLHGNRNALAAYDTGEDLPSSLEALARRFGPLIPKART